MSQLNLLPDDSLAPPDRLAANVVDAIIQLKASAMASGETSMKRSQMIAAVLPHCRRALDAPQRASTRRDVLFDAMCRVCGITQADLTKPQARLIAVAVAHIRRATPSVTPEEIERRARAYQRKFSGASVTAPALSNHWASFGNGGAPAKPDVYREPAGWRDKLRAKGWDRERVEELCAMEWRDVPITVRTELL